MIGLTEVDVRTAGEHRVAHFQQTKWTARETSKTTTASGCRDEFGHSQPPRAARNLLSSSTAWLMVNVAGSWRGGNSLNVSRNCVAIADPKSTR